ncbi:hypothetical protein F6A13_11085 [Acidithiobacillus sp. 'AMD consortium']|jgi:hypothetical protein|uniref:Uncharacterized protein n=3 Tax=Acidithiobacillus ferrooxidans TaxID=920 RepID=B7J722_ACIF2|nr:MULTISPECIES: hypothetical protein [Acidithiobacillus]ACH84319.1 hypothetical protein Lferr_2113 [Acidithiobacillus ferrooxidans ATCC 53993]ACK79839.1 hypothetical protein AFE_2487 [Acidithiobacillus ferrooxidans ATCC 23270]MBN6743953.1 hypothetical protein [Acidithiobacillus sp. MC2.2]MBN6749056.1 hypothetical protein [Acidithiobacillus sp. PG05]MBU2717924.1 hypothetical protein [Acidithiobacillus ferridurans]
MRSIKHANKKQVMQLHPPISVSSIIAMHETHHKDKERILRCLRNGPRTCKEVADALKLSCLRTNHLIVDLAKQGLVHAHHCTINASGSPINVWALPSSETPPLLAGTA